MKALKKIMLIAVITVSLLSAGCLPADKKTTENNSETDMISVPILKEGNPGARNMKLIVSLWNNLPTKYQQLLVDEGWKICVTDKSLKTKLNVRSEAAGVTFPEHKTIYFTNKSSSIEHSFYHEIGHVIDFIYDEVSQSAEFLSALENDKQNFMKNCKAARYYTESSHEYFAESFEIFITDALLLEQNCSMTYKIISEL